MAKQKLYHIYDTVSGLNWVVMAKSFKKAEEKCRESVMEFWIEEECDLIIAECETDGFQVDVKIKIS